jgi:cytidyltransferase-like protein
MADLTPSRSNGSGGDLRISRSSSGMSGILTSALADVTTEGWLELFLNAAEKRTFSRWQETINDKSLTHRATKNLFDRVANLIPDNVAPNVITAAGFACLGQAWYVQNLYGAIFPTAVTWFAVVNIIIFFITNSVDSRHADRLRQRSALGELFKYSCDCCSTVFLIILATYCLGGTSNVTQWYAVQATQLVLFTKHLSAFHRNAGLRYNVLTGPGEVILTVVVVLALRAAVGLDWLVRLYEMTLHRFMTHLDEKHDIEVHEDIKDIITDPDKLGPEMIQLFYAVMYVTALVKTLLLKKEHNWSRFGIIFCLTMRFIPAVFLRWGVYPATYELTAVDVVVDGLFLAVLTSDVTLAKMAGREIHPWVVLMSSAAILSHATIIFLVIVYYIAVFADLCCYLNMPLLTVCRNVYCDGVYDLCHIGHKTLFRNALMFGNRLFVGVVGDKDASAYKRPPIMTHDERCAEVEACKSVTKVIQNCPCFGLTKEFLDYHQIHVVAFGEEYLERYPDPKDDPYYAVPRIMGIARPLPRTKGLSTSDLIKRIQRARPADERNDNGGDS